MTRLVAPGEYAADMRETWLDRPSRRERKQTAHVSDEQIVANLKACLLAMTTRAHDFLTANDAADFLRASRALAQYVPPIQRVADVSERIEDLSDVPDAPREERRAIRDAASPEERRDTLDALEGPFS